MSEPSVNETSDSQRGALRPAYLILGDDRPKVELALHRLRVRIVQESGTELNVDEFVAGHHSASEVVSAANTLAFLGGIRLVLVHEVDSWKKADKDILVAYLRSPAPDACMALVAEKLPPTDPLRKGVSGVGDVLEYNAPRSAQLPDWVVKQARLRGVSLALPEARLLLQRSGENQHLLLREIEKLGAYCGESQVTADDINMLATRTLEASIFDLVDAVVGGRPEAAFTAVEELFAAGEKPTGLFYRILRHYQHLDRAVAMREAGWAAPRIQGEIKMKPFAARKLMQQAQSYDAETMRRALGYLASTDAHLKGMGTLPPELEFELMLGRLLSKR